MTDSHLSDEDSDDGHGLIIDLGEEEACQSPGSKPRQAKSSKGESTDREQRKCKRPAEPEEIRKRQRASSNDRRDPKTRRELARNNTDLRKKKCLRTRKQKRFPSKLSNSAADKTGTKTVSGTTGQPRSSAKTDLGVSQHSICAPDATTTIPSQRQIANVPYGFSPEYLNDWPLIPDNRFEFDTTPSTSEEYHVRVESVTREQNRFHIPSSLEYGVLLDTMRPAPASLSFDYWVEKVPDSPSPYGFNMAGDISPTYQRILTEHEVQGQCNSPSGSETNASEPFLTTYQPYGDNENRVLVGLESSQERLRETREDCRDIHNHLPELEFRMPSPVMWFMGQDADGVNDFAIGRQDGGHLPHDDVNEVVPAAVWYYNPARDPFITRQRQERPGEPAEVVHVPAARLPQPAG